MVELRREDPRTIKKFLIMLTEMYDEILESLSSPLETTHLEKNIKYTDERINSILNNLHYI